MRNHHAIAGNWKENANMLFYTGIAFIVVFIMAFFGLEGASTTACHVFLGPVVISSIYMSFMINSGSFSFVICESAV